MTAKKTKLFISYSRKDRNAVEGLYDGLSREDALRVFRDTDDILPTEEWKPRLEKLIRASDTVIFALSPHSVRSDICLWELELAQELNKRIIPVVIENVDGQVPDVVSKLNYIFLTKNDVLATGLTKIQDAISLDIDWIREHTRLGELADRWDQTVRLGAQPLRGAELEAAELWVAQQPKDAPQPTELQRRYIFESRKSATKRMRTILVGAACAMLVVGVLGVFAWTQRNIAIASETQSQQSLSVANLNLSEARISQKDWANALSLSQQALASASDPRAIAQEAITLASTAGVEIRPAKTLTALDGHKLIAFDDQSLAHFTRELATDQFWVFPGAGAAAMDASPLVDLFETDPHRLGAVYTTSGTLFVFTVEDDVMKAVRIAPGQQLTDLTIETAQLPTDHFRMFFAANGNKFATPSDKDGTLVIYETADLERKLILPLKSYVSQYGNDVFENVQNLVFTPDGDYMTVLFTDYENTKNAQSKARGFQRLVTWDLRGVAPQQIATLAPLDGRKFRGGTKGFGYSAQLDVVVTLVSRIAQELHTGYGRDVYTQHLTIYDAKTGSSLREVEYPREITDFHMGPDGRNALLRHHDAFQVIDLMFGTESATVSMPRKVHFEGALRQGTRATATGFSHGRDSEAYVFDLTPTISPVRTKEAPYSGSFDFFTSPNRTHVATITRDTGATFGTGDGVPVTYLVNLWSARDKSGTVPSIRLPLTSAVLPVMSQHGTLLAVKTPSVAIIYGLPDGNEMFRVPLVRKDHNATKALYFLDETTLVVILSNRIEHWELGGSSLPVNTIPLGRRPMEQIDIAPSQNFAFMLSQNKVWRLDLSTGDAAQYTLAEGERFPFVGRIKSLDDTRVLVPQAEKRIESPWFRDEGELSVYVSPNGDRVRLANVTNQLGGVPTVSASGASVSVFGHVWDAQTGMKLHGRPHVPSNVNRGEPHLGMVFLDESSLLGVSPASITKELKSRLAIWDLGDDFRVITDNMPCSDMGRAPQDWPCVLSNPE